jgi:hypothetical protein
MAATRRLTVNEMERVKCVMKGGVVVRDDLSHVGSH